CRLSDFSILLRRWRLALHPSALTHGLQNRVQLFLKTPARLRKTTGVQDIRRACESCGKFKKTCCCSCACVAPPRQACYLCYCRGKEREAVEGNPPRRRMGPARGVVDKTGRSCRIRPRLPKDVDGYYFSIDLWRRGVLGA
ncbi:hypothetical protein LCGC14_3117740, partial [marine sediment metagenome]